MRSATLAVSLAVGLVSAVGCGSPEDPVATVLALADSCDSGDAAACQGLAETATSHQEQRARAAATSRVRDPELLERLAGDFDAGVRGAAVAAIHDQEVLRALATSPHPDVRQRAIRRLTSQEALAALVMDPEVPADAAAAATSLLADEGLALLEARNAELRRNPSEALGRHVRLLRLVVVDEVPTVPGQPPDRHPDFDADLRQIFGDLLTEAPVSGEMVATFVGEGVSARYEGKGGEAIEVTQGARIRARLCLRLEGKDLTCRSLRGVEEAPSIVLSSGSLPVNTWDPPFDDAYRDLAPGLIELAEELTGRELAGWLAGGAQHWRLREGAIRLLDDQEELARIATGRGKVEERVAAIAGLQDRDLLGTLGADPNVNIATAAKSRLTGLERRR